MQKLEEASHSIDRLIEFYYMDLYPIIENGSSFGQEFGEITLNYYWHMDVNGFLENVRELPAGCVDSFAYNMVAALGLRYQYEQITEEEYNEFIQVFTELSTNEEIEYYDRQFVYEIMANLYRVD